MDRNCAALIPPVLLVVYRDWQRHFDDWFAAVHSCDVDIDHRSRTVWINLADVLKRVRLFAEAASAEPDAPVWREAAGRQINGMTRRSLAHAMERVRLFDEMLTACQDATGAPPAARLSRYKIEKLSDFAVVLQLVRRFGQIIGAARDVASVFEETGERGKEYLYLTELADSIHEVCRFGDAIIELAGPDTVRLADGTRSDRTE
jgi:hypothetical protein